MLAHRVRIRASAHPRLYGASAHRRIECASLSFNLNLQKKI